jgi:hypothetical protein
MPFVPDNPEQQAGGRFVPDKPAAAPAPPAEEGAYSPMNLMGRMASGAIEPMISMGTGLGATIAGGLGGIGQSIYNAMGIGDQRASGDVVRSIQNRFTYQPRGEGGQAAMKVFGAIPEAIQEHVAAPAGRKVQDITGSPGLAAQTETALNFLPQALMSKGAGTLKAPPIKPSLLSPEAKMLAQRDVQLTPGQMGGPQFSKAESAVEKWPVVGAPIREAKTRATLAFDRSAINDSLTPIKEKLPENVVGRDAIAYAQDKLGAKYDDLQGKMTGSLYRTTNQGPPDLRGPGGGGPWPPPEIGPTLAQDLSRIESKSDLPPEYRSELNRILNTEIRDRFDKKSGLADGETVKKIESQLTGLIKDKQRSSNQYEREQALAIRDARTAFRQMLGRDNPGIADELQTLNGAYAKFKIVQNASTRVGAREGIFTPSHLEQAVRAKDMSKDKSAYGRGEALMQDLSTAGKKVMGEYLPDSGTPYQMALIGEVLSGLSGILKTGGGYALSKMLYSQPGLALAQRLMQRPPTFSGVGPAQVLTFGAANQVQSPPQ